MNINNLSGFYSFEKTIEKKKHQDNEWLECKTLANESFYMNRKTGEKISYERFMIHQEMTQKIKKQKKIIDRLSRKIQRKNQEYKKLKSKKIPPTLYGREVIIVPDSIMNKIAIVDKDCLNLGDDKNV